jgi:hypothetical protein
LKSRLCYIPGGTPMPIRDLLPSPPPAAGAPMDWRARARRVRGLRWALPALAAALIAALGLWAWGDRAPVPPPPPARPAAEQPERWDTALSAPRFSSRDDAGRPFSVTAARALRQAGEAAPVLLEAPAAEVALDEGRTATLTAELGRYDSTARRLALTHAVTARLEPDGHWLRAPTLEVDFAAGTAVSEQAVQGGGPGLALTAAGLRAASGPEGGREVITLTGPGRVVLEGAEPGGDPATVTARDALVWDRGAQLFTARGAARATRAGATVTANTLEAAYTPADGDAPATVTRAWARGDVVLARGQALAYGDAADYDLAAGRGSLTGAGGVRATMPGQVLTARAFTYSAADGRVVARGPARLERDDGAWLAAPHMAATLAPGPGGAREVSAIEAWGGVTAADAQGNRLAGPRATVDPRTGVATIVGGQGGAGRARAVLYPDSDGGAEPPF